MKKFPSDSAKKFNVRMSDELHSQLKAAAAINRRSLNSEILVRLGCEGKAKMAPVSGDHAAQLRREGA
ncbi:Arc family DNA-binding protein [Stagnihabitans tardus]|uniref:Arc family DNA-binding protein n=1 Tax=Stagnihabitans tardus TaxID=2699202 RepID=A0AAE5BV45_9RHOB|nr:Arc family DNA-binding protein [Stagnihabitans tardus]NBZ87922.1 Arc family DNA-binding protein [Stagnihabitans tardus]